ncbi:MAG: FAD-dependent oxidoreductase [Nitrososphaeraceae archaeon]
MNNRFDLIVIGTGTAASTAAYKCRSAGWKVAVIDSLPFGGTCALRGCDPKKVLVEAAKVIDSTLRHENKGVTGSEGIRIKWSDLMSFKRTFTEPRPELSEKAYVEAGIVPFHGHAQFTGPTTIKVKKDHSNVDDNWGLRFRTIHKNTSDWASSRRLGESCSGFKVLIEEGTDRILGAHIVGPHAEEVINIFSIAIRLGLTATALNDHILYSYPTNSSDVIYMLSA